MTKTKNSTVEETRVTSFQVGPDAEKDIVCTEMLLMKLALIGSVIGEMNRYIDEAVKSGGMAPEIAPDDWAISGALQNLQDVAHALKAGCWGYETAFLR